MVKEDYGQCPEPIDILKVPKLLLHDPDLQARMRRELDGKEIAELLAGCCGLAECVQVMVDHVEKVRQETVEYCKDRIDEMRESL